MVEVWKPIIIEKKGVVFDFTGLYEVSNLGKIRSLDRIDASGHKLKGKVLKPWKRKDGYLHIGLYTNGKRETFYVHRLVGYAFIPNDDPEHKTEINHINEDKTDNRVSNLSWVTPKQNANYGTRNERSAKKQINGKTSKKVVCIETGKVYLSTKDVKRKLGLAQSSISKCCKGKYKTCGGYHWQFYKDYLLDINEKNEELLVA